VRDAGSLGAETREDTVSRTFTDAKFDEAYRTHHGGVHRYVLRLVDDAAIADELAQDAFVRAYQAWDGFRGEASVRTWLFRIARNVSLDYLRSPRSRDRVQSLLAYPGQGGDQFSDAGTTPGGSETGLGVAETVRQAEMSDCVRQFMAELPETLQTPLILHDLEGFTNAEIADLLHCSLAAAKMRLHRARRRLQLLVEQRCDLFHDERDVLSCLPGSPDRPTPPGPASVPPMSGPTPTAMDGRDSV